MSLFRRLGRMLETPPEKRSNPASLPWWEVSDVEKHFKSPPEVSMSDRAHQFLGQLKDFGLVDDEMEEQILNRLMLAGSTEVSLDDLKRIAATTIFEHQFDGTEEYFGIFEEEWKLLFN